MTVVINGTTGITNPNNMTVGNGGGSVATNTAVGTSALATNSTGPDATAVGYQAGYSSTGGYLTAVGYKAGYAVSSGTDNVFMGWNTGLSTTTGSSNVAMGDNAFRTNTTGGSNLALGHAALYSNTTAGRNTAVGYLAGYENTTGHITAVGAYTLWKNTTGTSNVAVGGNDESNSAALQYNTTGSYNTAVGGGALQANTTASNNTAVGYGSGLSITTGAQNTVIGRSCGNVITTGNYNTFLGYAAGSSATTGSANTFIGTGASGGSGEAITTGQKNTILGPYTGNQGSLDIRTASNYIILSDGDGNPRGWASTGGAWVFSSGTAASNRYYFDGYYLAPSQDNTIGCGFSNQRWTVVYAVTGTINTSDANTKQDIAALDDAEKRVAIRIKSLIKKYRFRDAVAAKGDAARIHIGAVAQEVAAAFEAEGLDPERYALFCSDTWYEVDGQSQDVGCVKYTAETPNAVEVTRLGLRYDELLAFVIAAL